MLCKFRNNQLKSHFFYKIPNIKKHVTFFENLIADLKSSRKNASETVFILTRTFHKNFNIGKLHCEQFTAIHFEIGEKLKKLFLKKKINKSHKIHRNYLSCQIVILRGIFHFFDPKLDFSYISRHVLSDSVKNFSISLRENINLSP